MKNGITFERFKEIWDKCMPANAVFGGSELTRTAYIEYGQGNTEKVERVKVMLGHKEFFVN